jgi:hypothetical protein
VTIPADGERNSLTDTLATTEELVAKPLENSSALNHAERTAARAQNYNYVNQRQPGTSGWNRKIF